MALVRPVYKNITVKNTIVGDERSDIVVRIKTEKKQVPPVVTIIGVSSNHNLYIPKAAVNELKKRTYTDKVGYPVTEQIGEDIKHMMRAIKRHKVVLDSAGIQYYNLCYKTDDKSDTPYTLLGIDNPYGFQIHKDIYPGTHTGKSVEDLIQCVNNLHLFTKGPYGSSNTHMKKSHINQPTVINTLGYGFVLEVTPTLLRIRHNNGDLTTIQLGISLFDNCKYWTNLKLNDTVSPNDILVYKTPPDQFINMNIENTQVTEKDVKEPFAINQYGDGIVTGVTPHLSIEFDRCKIVYDNDSIGKNITFQLGHNTEDGYVYSTDLKIGDSVTFGDVLVYRLPMQTCDEDVFVEKTTSSTDPVESTQADWIKSNSTQSCIVELDALQLHPYDNGTRMFKISDTDIRRLIVSNNHDSDVISVVIGGEPQPPMSIGFPPTSEFSYGGYTHSMIPLDELVKQSGFTIKTQYVQDANSGEYTTLALILSTTTRPHAGVLFIPINQYSVTPDHDDVIHSGEYNYHGDIELLAYLSRKIFNIRKITIKSVDSQTTYKTELQWAKDRLKSGVIPRYAIFRNTSEMITKSIHCVHQLWSYVDTLAENLANSK